jgi:hypothetical protein
MVGALKPGVSRHGRDDRESGSGERVLHIESVIEEGGVERLKAVFVWIYAELVVTVVNIAGTLEKECEVGEEQVKTWEDIVRSQKVKWKMNEWRSEMNDRAGLTQYLTIVRE